MAQDGLSRGELFSDSREIGPGIGNAVFFAYEGDSADGRNYISNAIENGAVAVIYESEGFSWNRMEDTSFGNIRSESICGSDCRCVLWFPGKIHAGYCRHGHNGKTSSTQFIGQSLSKSGKKTAVIGTLGISVFENGKNGISKKRDIRRPIRCNCSAIWPDCANQGVECVAMEASSIGIDQGRLNGIPIDIALFTNFTRDHLDYHHGHGRLQARKGSFSTGRGLKHAVLNLDDPMGIELANELAGKVALTGFTLESVTDTGFPVLRAYDLRNRIHGIEFRVESPVGTARVRTLFDRSFQCQQHTGCIGCFAGGRYVVE